MTIWRMCISCWIPKATHAHTQYVLLITFPLQQRMHERASMLRYTYSARPLSYVCKSAFDGFMSNLLQAQSSRGVFRQLQDTRVVVTRTVYE